MKPVGAAQETRNSAISLHLHMNRWLRFDRKMRLAAENFEKACCQPPFVPPTMTPFIPFTAVSIVWMRKTIEWYQNRGFSSFREWEREFACRGVCCGSCARELYSVTEWNQSSRRRISAAISCINNTGQWSSLLGRGRTLPMDTVLEEYQRLSTRKDFRKLFISKGKPMTQRFRSEKFWIIRNYRKLLKCLNLFFHLIDGREKSHHVKDNKT